mmetsp:Transcript_55020/g.89193  ORF Transcript_55020/g.89193 Transcript_55020/m.89193 type:complete len:99 (-) Transcript_55020:730-1026(-)
MSTSCNNSFYVIKMTLNARLFGVFNFKLFRCWSRFLSLHLSFPSFWSHYVFEGLNIGTRKRAPRSAGEVLVTNPVRAAVLLWGGWTLLGGVSPFSWEV